jgi:two-component system, sensor histidine kinase and response regulator
MTDPIEVLLVDDTPENLVALEALLRRDGVTLHKASSGAEALELLLVHDISLALLDVQMPEMDGFELAELMRGKARTRHVPIIFITAGARDPGRVFKGYGTGAVDFLFKPIDPHILRSKVDVFLELARQRQALAHALRLNELFVGIVGHDLRSPLAALLGGAELLAHQISDPGQRRTLARMMSAGTRMTEMIEQLLDLTRARLTGGLGFVRSRVHVDLRELVQRTIDEQRAPDLGRELALEVTGDTTTTGDPERLLQLFANLMTNAFIHGRPGEPIRVAITGRGHELLVVVRNQGAIPRDVLPTLFEPFRSARRSSASGGLGLGMYIAQQIARAHDGDITVTTDEVATTVTVTLPRHLRLGRTGGANGEATGSPGSPDLPDLPDLPDPPGLSGPAARAAPGGASILIVEDEDMLRETLREALEGESYSVATAANGEEALDRLRRDEPLPDLVVLDLAMPVLDGNGLYEAMQLDPRLAGIPVLVSTADPASAPPGVPVLCKPVKLARLLDEIAQLGARPTPAYPGPRGGMPPRQC